MTICSTTYSSEYYMVLRVRRDSRIGLATRVWHGTLYRRRGTSQPAKREPWKGKIYVDWASPRPVFSPCLRLISLIKGF